MARPRDCIDSLRTARGARRDRGFGAKDLSLQIGSLSPAPIAPRREFYRLAARRWQHLWASVFFGSLSSSLESASRAAASFSTRSSLAPAAMVAGRARLCVLPAIGVAAGATICDTESRFICVCESCRFSLRVPIWVAVALFSSVIFRTGTQSSPTQRDLIIFSSCDRVLPCCQSPPWKRTFPRRRVAGIKKQNTFSTHFFVSLVHLDKVRKTKNKHPKHRGHKPARHTAAHARTREMPNDADDVERRASTKLV